MTGRADGSEHEYPLIADDGKRTGTVLFGRVKLFHVRSDLFVEGQGTATDIAKLMPVSRVVCFQSSLIRQASRRHLVRSYEPDLRAGEAKLREGRGGGEVQIGRRQGAAVECTARDVPACQ